MRKIRLGRTGLMVSEIGFGGIPINRLSNEEAVDLIRYCFAQGIDFYDTANMYGESEAMLGQALEGARDRVILATKSRNLDAAGLREHLRKSLELLRTDYIDLFQAHNISKQEELDQLIGPGGAHEALVQATEEGKVRHIGISSHNPDIALKACRTGLFSTIQMPFNFVEPQVEERVFAAARELDMGLIAMKPLGGGLLDNAGLCFGFLRQYPDILPIPGIQARAEIDEIISLYRDASPLTAEQEVLMRSIQEEMGPRWCHRCGYCLPCSEEIDIPMAFLFKSATKRNPPQRVVQLMGEVMKKAEGCIECGECEERCPYELPIREMLADTVEYYHQYAREQGMTNN